MLTAYTKSSNITVDKGAEPGADSTVIVSGLPPVDKDAAKKTQSAVRLADQFVAAHPVVVAGNGVGDGNLVSALRGDPTMVTKISTVDNADTTQGQLAAVLATIERVTTGKVGHFGLTAGSSSQIPKVVF